MHSNRTSILILKRIMLVNMLRLSISTWLRKEMLVKVSLYNMFVSMSRHAKAHIPKVYAVKLNDVRYNLIIHWMLRLYIA